MRDIIEQYEHNVRKGPLHESSELLPCQAPDVYPVRYLAYYLPQFHTIKVNDDAWGKGFTEWTNTTKALPRYIGQYQPRLPADLGFYNLNDPGVIRKQVDLARRGGIYGFCLHYYWFSGKKILNKPLSLILSNADIDFPFCINWANESWTRTWDGTEQSVLLKQEYREEDPLLFAQDLAELVQDRRYITVHGRPLIMLYRPGVVPDIPRTVDIWREFFLKQGLRDPYIIMPQAFGDDDPLAYGLDAAAGFPPHKCGFSNRNDRWKLKALDPDFVGVTVSYDRMIDEALSNRPTEFRYFPGVCPQWDNEARRPKRGFSVYGSTPQKYGDWLRAASVQAVRASSADERIVFINAWNEWAEGAYLEPDQHYGFAYLAETRRALDGLIQNAGLEEDLQVKRSPPQYTVDKFVTEPLFRNQLRSLGYAARRRLLKKISRGR